MLSVLLLAVASAAGAADAAQAPKEWVQWREERRTEIGGRFSPAATSLMITLRAGSPEVLERRDDGHYRVRLETEPASGVFVGRLAVSSSAVSFVTAASTIRLSSGAPTEAGGGLGLVDYGRGEGRFTMLLYELERPGLEKRKRTEVFPYDPRARGLRGVLAPGPPPTPIGLPRQGREGLDRYFPHV